MGALLGSLGAPPFRSFRPPPLPAYRRWSAGDNTAQRRASGSAPAESTPKGPLNATGCVLAHLLILSSLSLVLPLSLSLSFLSPFARALPRPASPVVHFTLAVVLRGSLEFLPFWSIHRSWSRWLVPLETRVQSPTSVFPSTLCRLKPASSSFPVVRIRIANVSY